MGIDNKTKIIVAVIGAIAIIAASTMPFLPWNKKTPQGVTSIKQYNLSGTVVDQSSNESVARAQISIVGRNEAYYSEQNGNFNLDFMDSLAKVRIRVVKEGYQTFDHSYNISNTPIIIPLIPSIGRSNTGN